MQGFGTGPAANMSVSDVAYHRRTYHLLHLNTSIWPWSSSPSCKTQAGSAPACLADGRVTCHLRRILRVNSLPTADEEAQGRDGQALPLRILAKHPAQTRIRAEHAKQALETYLLILVVRLTLKYFCKPVGSIMRMVMCSLRASAQSIWSWSSSPSCKTQAVSTGVADGKCALPCLAYTHG
jgi:hypothetical protein